MTDVAVLIPDIALVAKTAKADLLDAAKAFFAVTDAFRIGRIEDAARSIAPSDYYDGLALSRAGDIDRRGEARHGGRGAVGLRQGGRAGRRAGSKPAANGSRRTRERLQALTEGGDITVSRLSVASGLMGDLTAR